MAATFEEKRLNDLVLNTSSDNSLIKSIQFNQSYEGRAAYVWTILGNRTTFVNTTDIHDICEFLTSSITNIQPTTADALEVVSTSANDSPSGIGTRQIQIIYLDAEGILTQSSPIALNGTTPVPLNFISTSILWIEAIEGGTNQVSSGTITLRKVGTATIYEQITIGGNKSLSARMTIPKNFTGYLVSWAAEAIQQNSDVRLRATVKSLDRSLNSRYLFQDRIYLAATATLSKDLHLLRCPELSRIKVSVIPSNVNARVDASFSIILIENISTIN
jgi:hypothetical protein